MAQFRYEGLVAEATEMAKEDESGTGCGRGCANGLFCPAGADEAGRCALRASSI